MQQSKRTFGISLGFHLAFLLWTMVVCTLDVQQIGPEGSMVGLASLNAFIHSLTGVNFALYIITDWLGLVPLVICMGFGLLGLSQWIRRKHLLKVDRSILVLGGFYVIVAAVFLLFESVVVNYRPVLINGVLEASYPSSTTILVMCVMPTAMMQLRERIRRKDLRMLVITVMTAFMVFMFIARLISGVHWFSDIVGGALLSAGLVTLYDAVVNT